MTIYEYHTPAVERVVVGSDTMQALLRKYLLYEKGIDLPDGAKITVGSAEVEWHE